jgi:hemerythrin-like domain-containing protein
MDTITRRTASDAIEMLESDHGTMKQLLSEYHAARGDRKIAIAEQLFEEIQIHAKIAKEVLYPVVRSRSRFEGRRLVRAALREQGEIIDLIVSLQEMAHKNGKFTAGMKKVEALIERHIDTEEEDMLSLAERILDSDTETVGLRMLDLRLQLVGAGSPLG